MTPARCPILIPGTCEYVALHGKRDFVGVIKVRVVRWRDNPGSLGDTNIITRALRRRKEEGQGPRRRGEKSRGENDVAMSHRRQQPC